MIRFADNQDSNNDKSNLDINKIKNLLKAIFDNSGYSAGSFHQEATLVDLVDMTEQILFKQNHSSLHLIIDRNPNNSLDITIDKVE